MRTCERPYATVLGRIGCGGLPDREVKPCGKPARVRHDTLWHKGPAVLCDDCHRELSTPLGEHVPRSAWENRHHSYTPYQAAHPHDVRVPLPSSTIDPPPSPMDVADGRMALGRSRSRRSHGHSVGG